MNKKVLRWFEDRASLVMLEWQSSTEGDLLTICVGQPLLLVKNPDLLNQSLWVESMVLCL